jgi:hypothetical protein
MTDQAQGVLIKYSIDEIFACREDNCVVPKELSKYCVNMRKSQLALLSDLQRSMDDITRSHSQGINPNDISLKNMIRDALNKINNNNYEAVLDDLKSLSYTSDNHFILLATELIIKSMNDVMACKSIEPKAGIKTPSEIYMTVACEFSNYQIKQKDSTVKFKTVLSKECVSYFRKFMDKEERMDQNNPHRVSNYKGFMNMIGLMYVYKLFSIEIIKMCFNDILTLILESDIPQDDSDNYYSGFERLLNRLLIHFEKDIMTNEKNVFKTPHQRMVDEFDTIKNFIKDYNDKISKTCNEEYIKKNKGYKPPIKIFSIMAHKHNIERFDKLCDIYSKH